MMVHILFDRGTVQHNFTFLVPRGSSSRGRTECVHRPFDGRRREEIYGARATVVMHVCTEEI
jgi:hypothetical protein